ncbi:MAG: 4Fe-4S dicluster domain-containing protein [Synergistaceae bacterium]|nr:4Fe-4S dicluster domain-containing protein [Synergistaceae bacterium]
MAGHDPNLNFKNEVASRPGGERALNCFLCGTCTAGCPISELDGDFNPRLIMRRILFGMKDEVLGDGGIWKCYQCHVCVAHCPQDVRFADIIRVLRGMSVEQGYFKAELARYVEDADKSYRGELLERVKSLLREAAAK